jgi:predicted RNA-binding protein with PIN domain
MSARFHIIDGYNLLYAAGFGKADYAPGELLRARTRLLRKLLDELSPAEVSRTTVVFDAREPPPGRPDRVNVGGITVVFAREGGVADDLIVEMVRSHSAPKQVTVVSSDHRIQRGIRARRGEAVDSDVFLDRLSGRARAVKPSPAPQPPPPPETELEHWISVFGQVSTQQEIADSDLPTPSPSTKVPQAKPPAARVPPKRSPGPSLPDASDLAGWETVFGDMAADPDDSVVPLLPTGRTSQAPPPGEETELGRRRPLPPKPVARPSPEKAPRAEKGPPPPPPPVDARDQAVDVDYWLGLFGPVDPRDTGESHA